MIIDNKKNKAIVVLLLSLLLLLTASGKAAKSYITSRFNIIHNNAEYYLYSGNVKADLGDYKGAIADFNKSSK